MRHGEQRASLGRQHRQVWRDVLSGIAVLTMGLALLGGGGAVPAQAATDSQTPVPTDLASGDTTVAAAAESSALSSASSETPTPAPPGEQFATASGMLSENDAVTGPDDSLSGGSAWDAVLQSGGTELMARQAQALVNQVQKDKYKFHKAPLGVKGDKGNGHFVYNANHRFHVVFNEDGTVVAHDTPKMILDEGGKVVADPQSQPWTWEWETTGYGRDGNITAPAHVTRESSDTQITYDYGPFSMWYVDDEERGLEQGFILPAAPEGSGPVVITARTNLAVTGQDTAQIAVDGQPIMAYTGLKAQDASGLPVDVRLEATADGLRIVVDDTGRTYPITVDPWFGIYAGYFNAPGGGAVKFGWSVAIGDYDGDGDKDIAIGAPDWNSYQGAVFVALGNGVGFPSGYNSNFQRFGAYANTEFGMYLQTARINTDAIDDLVVSGPGFGWGDSLSATCSSVPATDPCPRGWTGQVIAYTGGSGGWAATPAWTGTGPEPDSRYGEMIAVGDYNGDGKQDLAVGANGADANGWQGSPPRPTSPFNSGKVYVFYNTGSTFNTNAGNVINSGLGYAQLGFFLAAGDVNGDGADDLAVGSTNWAPSGGSSAYGKVFVWLGVKGGTIRTDAYLNSSSGDNAAWSYAGGAAGDRLGYSISLGDVNGDGKDDLCASAPWWNNNYGRVYCFHGQLASPYLGGLAWSAWGSASPQRFGWATAISAARTYGNLAVGYRYYTNGSASESGRVDVYPGSSNGLTPTWNGSTSPTPAWYWAPSTASENAGSALAWGDFNTGGQDDLAVGAPGYNSENGRVYVFNYDATAPSNPTTTTEKNYGITSGSWTNQASPAFNWSGASDGSGSGVAGYYVYWGISSTGTSTTYQTGNSYTPATLTSSGSYYLRVATRDNMGNVAEWKSLFLYGFDKDAPTVGSLVATDSSGSTDNVWQKTTNNPNFTWTAATDGHSGVKSYNYYWGTSSSGACATNTISRAYDPPAVTGACTYYLRINAVDNVNNVSTCLTEYTFKYDATAPSNPSSTTESHGVISGTWTSQASPSFTWSGASDGSCSGIAGYWVYWGTNSSADPAAYGTYQTGNTYAPTGLVSGNTYYLRLRTKDNMGNLAAASTVSIYKFDNTAPTNPSGPAQAPGCSDGVWNDQPAPTFTWSAASDSGSGVVGYWVYWGTNSSADPAVSGTFQTGNSHSPAGLVSGSTYYLRLRAKDTAGNLAATTTLFVDKFDALIPESATLGVTESHGLSSDTWNNQAAPSFTWTGFKDTQSGIAGYWVYWGLDSTADPATAGTYQTSNTYAPTNLNSDKSYYLILRAKDNAGNLSDPVSAFTDKYDCLSPLHPIYATEQGGASDNVWQNTINQPDFVWYGAADTLHGSGLAGYNGYFGTDPNGTGPTISTGVGWTDPTPVSDGIYYLRLQSCDHAGNLSGWKTVFTLKYDSTIPSQPISVTTTPGGLPNSAWTNIVLSSLSWTGAIDDASGVAGYYVYWGTEATADPQVSGSYQVSNTLTIPPVASGSIYYLIVRTQDVAGNLAAASKLFTYKYDNSTPANPTSATEDHGAQNNVWQNTGNDPAFHWEAGTDTPSGVAGYYWYFGPDDDGVPATYTTTAAADPAAVGGSGTYYLRIQTQDNAGNISAPATLFTFEYDATAPDNPPPGIEAGGTPDDTWTKVVPTSLSWSRDTDGNSGVAGYYVYWGANATADPQVSGSYQVSNTLTISPVASGSIYYLIVRTQDIAGNLADAGTLFTYRYDGLAPANPASATEEHGAQSGAPDNEWQNTGNDPAFHWEAGTDTPSGVAGYYWYFGPDDEGTPATWTTIPAADPAAVSDGIYYLRVTTQDTADNLSEPMTIFTFKYDATPPTNAVSVTVSPAIASDTWQNSVSTLVTATLQGAGDPDGSGLAGFNTYWGIDSSGACTSTVTGNSIYDLGPVPSGTPYYLRVQARDLAGNLSACETRFILKHDNEPPTPAEITFPGLSGGQ